MKSVIFSLSIGAFAYCLLANSATAQYTRPSPPTYETKSPSPSYGSYSPSKDGYPSYSPPVVGYPTASPPSDEYPAVSPSPEGYSPESLQGYSPKSSPHQGYSPESPSPVTYSSPPMTYSPPPLTYSPSPVSGNSPPVYGNSPTNGHPEGGYPEGGYPQGSYPEGGYPQGGSYPEGDKPGYQPSPKNGYPSPSPTKGGYPSQSPPKDSYPSIPPLTGCQTAPSSGSQPGNGSGSYPGSGSENGAPGNSTPGNGAPGNSTPGNSAPSNSTPGNGTPGNGTPGSSTPGNGTPGNGNGNSGNGDSPQSSPMSPPNGDSPQPSPVSPTNGGIPSSPPVSPINGGSPQSPPVSPPNGGSPQSPPVSPPVSPPGGGLIPGLFTNPSTAYDFPDSAQQCKTQCSRRSVKTWSDADWTLYGQLFKAANDKGYIADLVAGHRLDRKPLPFHFNKAFFPWHRFFLAHFEQILQKVDSEINPGKATQRGDFCLGYWDYGYQEPFNNNLMDQVYEYVFNGKAMGTLRQGSNPIPNSEFQDLAVASVGQVLRDPSPGSNSWSPAAIGACIDHDVYQDEGTQAGFWSCIENGVHAAIHNSIGGVMANIGNSPADPAFFLHHAMIDHIWYIWQRQSGKTYGANFNAEVPQPYGKWMLDDAKDYNRFCYDYESQGSGAQKSDISTTTGVSTNFANLQQTNKDAITRTLTAGEPKLIPKEKFTFLRSHAKSDAEFEVMYAKYARQVYEQQVKYNILYATFQASFQAETKQKAQASTLDAAPVVNSMPKISYPIGAPPSMGAPPVYVSSPPPAYISSPPVAYQANQVASSSTSSSSNKNLAKLLNALTGSLSN